MLKRNSKAFTLIELIVVTAIIAVLCSMAVPHFLQAQTRAKVTGARSNLRVLSQATEAYRVDWNGYPAAVQRIPEDPYGILSDVQLAVLTTPRSYVSPTAFRDPFGKVKQQNLIGAMTFQVESTDFPIPEVPNPNRSLLYYNYLDFADWTGNPLVRACGVATLSIGPDRQDTFGVFRPFPEEALPPLARRVGLRHPLDTEYDPTNGCISRGDLIRFAGEVHP